MIIKSGNAPDFSDCIALQKQLTKAVNDLMAMTGEVAKARHVTTFDSDRRRRVLAIATMPFLKAGGSSAASETEARASETYAAGMAQLGKELVAAEAVLAKFEALKIQIEVGRSLLSLSRATMTNL